MSENTTENIEIWSLKFTKIIFIHFDFVTSFPWNQQTLLGYFAEICCSIMMGEAAGIISGLFLLFFISMCLYHHAFYHMFRNMIKKLDPNDQPLRHKQLLCELIHFHIKAKRWVILRILCLLFYIFFQTLFST